MNILLSTFWKHPVTGGSAMYIEQLKQGLEKKGHKVEILAKHPNLNGYYLVNSGTYIDLNKLNNVVSSCFNRYFPSNNPMYQNTEIAHHCFELAASLLNLEQYDLIHTQDIFSTRLLSRVKPSHTPLVASIHGCIATEYLIHKRPRLSNKKTTHIDSEFNWKYTSWQEHAGASLSDQTIVATNWLKDLLIHDFNVDHNQITIIPYALDIDEFRNRMDEMSPVMAPPGKLVIVCPARLAFIKGHKYLFEALAKLKLQRTDWICWLVGDGNIRTELINMARNLKLEQNVNFIGTQKNVPAILKQADICVLSSLQESFPYAILEAQIAGKPVVVTDAGGLPEAVIHGQTGLISPKGNSELLYRNLRELLENEDLRKKLASNAENAGREKWAIEAMIKSTLTIYDQVIKTKKGGDVDEPI